MRWPDAACIGHVDLFFAEEVGRGAPQRRYEKEAEAKAICATCPRMQPCRQAALDNDERYGVWGATTPQERAAILGGRTDRRHKQSHE